MLLAVLGFTFAPAPSAAAARAAQIIPYAQAVPSAASGVPVTIHAQEQVKQGDLYTLQGEAEIDYKDYILRADTITYNRATGQTEAQGHVQLDGGPDQEDITAERADVNLNDQTGRFYHVSGSVGVQRGIGAQAVYTTPNPFLVRGKLLVKTGPESYALYGGSMTSCRIPKPHWSIVAPHIALDNGKATAWNSHFDLLGMPILYLPYVTHSVDANGRQSGFSIPVISNSSIKGKIIGEFYYWAINRSSDLMLGVQYYSLRGWEQSAEYRYKGRGNDFLHGYYDGLEDRGYGPQHINQGGQDTIVTGRRDLDTSMRAVVDAEYLSSYVYRQVFAENFALAVSSEVKSWAFLTHQEHGTSASLELERYQNYLSDVPGDEVRILHLPNLEMDTADQQLGRSRLFGGGEAAFSMLERSAPGTGNKQNALRADLYPHIAMPWVKHGWLLRTEAALRETAYSNSQISGPTTPTQQNTGINRSAIETGAELRTPVLERDFNSKFLDRRFGVALRHTIAPEVQYRYVAGINNFNHIERFDARDLYSDTNEMEYGLTQRLFTRALRAHPCKPDELAVEYANEKNATGAAQKKSHTVNLDTPTPTCEGDTQEWLSWFVAQKYFFDPTFGGAVIPGRRNIFTSTLDFSSIAYVTAPRHTSPVVSRLRMHSTENTDVEWDLEYDVKAGRMAASNVFANYKHGDFFTSVGHALMNAPAESIAAAGQPISVTNYNQLQLLLGYGATTKPGLSAAADGGLDVNLHSLEYAGVQTSYNFNCCGVSVEYRKFALGQVRNEHIWSASFTMTGVATAGNLKRAERLF
jgi:LPS-assembly protein